MLYPYPAAVSPEAWKAAAAVLRGQFDADTAHAAWEVVGYFGGQYDPNSKPLFQAMSNEALIAKCEEMATENPSLKGAGFPSWLQLLMPILLEALQKYLAK